MEQERRQQRERQQRARETMAPWDDFDAIFGFNKNVVYDGKVVEQIISNRRALDNRLFADRLLGLLGVKAGKKEEETKRGEEFRSCGEIADDSGCQ